MFTSSTDLLRSIVADKYFLKRVAGAVDDDALFLADAPDGTPVHVRLVPGGSPLAAAWPLIVEHSTRLIHPHLLRYLDSGDCRVDGQPYSFLVTEAVSDRVDEVLVERALTPDEADSVLRAALLALSHLHDNGFTHGDLRPASVVAANDLVKLTGETIAPLPQDEAAAKRSISAELLALGETATELLTRSKGPGAAATLPAPFAEFVRSAAGTSAVPHPTAMQLMEVLDGKELVPPPVTAQPAPPAPLAPPVVVPAVAAAVPPPPGPAPDSAVVAEVLSEEVPETAAPQDWSEEERRNTGRRNGTVLLAMLGIAVIALIVWWARRPNAVEPAAPAPAVTPAPTTPGRNPAPVPAAKRATPPASQQQQPKQQQWAVVAATYGNYAAALKRANQLASQSRKLNPIVLPPAGQGNRYYVVLGTAGSKKEAERIRSQARSAGIPGDSYVTRLQF